jgi:ATP-dependent helicase/nuclease subunit A
VAVLPGEGSTARAEQTVVPLRVLPGRTLTKLASEVVSPEDSLASRIGQAMHRLLEWAPLGAQAVPENQIQRVAGSFALDDAQARQAAQMATRILCGQGAWAWDAAQVVWHGNEVSLVIGGALRRLDRLVQLKSGAWWVLDFKSSQSPSEQASLMDQLRSYRQAVQALYPQQKVKAAFLSAQGHLHELDTA